MTDFVTNSSSSSFILVGKDGWSEGQKQAIIDYVENNLFGDLLLTPNSTEEEKNGKIIYSGCVDFENCDYQYAELFTGLWANLECCSDDNFETIDDSNDLSY